MSEQLNTPIITAEVFDTVKIRVSGLAVENASGYMLRFGNLPGYGVENVVTPAEGVLILQNNRMRVTYYIQARALGDDENYTNSDWSEPVAVTTGGVVDQSIPIPTISGGSAGFTRYLFTVGLNTGYGVRVQFATTEAGVESAPILIRHNNSTSLYFLGLQPGTTYYCRICHVGKNYVGLWSDIKTFTTNNTTSNVIVTNANDSGTGSLRAAVSGAASNTRITFDSSLSGQTITLSSNISIITKVLIDGSSLDSPVKISGGGSKSISGTQGECVGVWIDNNNLTQMYYSDCIITGMVISPYGLARCIVQDCSSISTSTNTVIQDSFIGGSFPSLSSINSVCNSFLDFSSSTASNKINRGNFFGCILTGKNSTGYLANNMTLCECDIVGNTVTGTGALLTNMNGRLNKIYNNTAQTIWDCGSTASYVCEDTYIGNSGVIAGKFNRCVIEPDSGTAAVGAATSWTATTLRDCLILGDCIRTSSVTYVGCTIKKITGGTAKNCLMGPGSTVSGNNNLLWDETDETADNYVGKVFADFANGDYHLNVGSPAFDAGNILDVQTNETDLDGNPRAVGNSVDVGCYELINVPLTPPVITVSTGAGGQGTVSYTLPAGGSAGILLQYADNSDFTNAQEISSTSTGIALTGMSGTVYFRAKFLGISGLTIDSDWSATQSAYFDAVSPIIVMDTTPIEMTVGDEVNFLAGVVVTDDVTTECSVHYQVLDSDNQPITVDGKTTDIDSTGIPVDPYTLVITASDDAGNIATASRILKVYRPMLDTPTITLDGVGKYGAEISGLVDQNASGWLLKTDGIEMAVAPVLGKVTVTGLNPATTHKFQAKAIGDFDYETYTGGWRNSYWSNEISISRESTTFFKWTAETVLSHDGRTYQNVELKAKIKDADTGELLPPIMVSSATFTAYYVVNGERVEVDGFSGVEVPLSAFSATALADGCNFHFVPDQTVQRLLRYPGYYVLQVDVNLTAGNPFTVYSEPISIF